MLPQILLVGQLPFILYFAIKSPPKNKKNTLRVLILQAIAGIIALAPVFLLEL